VVDESDTGWLNNGGASAILMQRTPGPRPQGQTIRVDIGEEIVDE
jgi:hypothetical protein